MGTVADQVAAFIGKTLGELMNRKDALAKQMAEVDGQIADVRKRVTEQFGRLVPAVRRRGRPAGSKNKTSGSTVASKKGRTAKRAKRVVSAETRAKMAAAARRRWAARTQNKG